MACSLQCLPHAEQTPCAQVNASGLPAREMNESAKTFNSDL